jgi:mannosyltransferase
MRANINPIKFFLHRKNILYLFLFSIIGISLRIYRLGFSYLWHDEACSIFAAEAFVHNIFAQGLFDSLSYNFVLTPVFCLLVKAWGFLGNTEFIIRLLPVIFGVFSIIVIYKLGKRLFNVETGLFSALLLSIAPFHIYHSQELRMYSLVGLLSLLAVYYFVKALEQNKNHFWAFYIIFNLINFYTHHMTVFVLLAQACFFLTYYNRYRNSTRKWLISHALILILLIPWIFNIFLGSKLNFTISTFYLHPLLNWILPPSLKNFFWVFKNFSIGFNAGRMTYVLAMASFLSLAIFGIFKSPKKENLFLILYLTLAPIIMVFVVSQLKYCFVIRYFLPSSFFYYILVANGFTKIRQGFLRFLILVFIIIATIFALKNYYTNYMPGSNVQFVAAIPSMDIKGAVKYVKENTRDEDIICHTDGLTLVPFEYYINFKKSPDYNTYLNTERVWQVLLSLPGEHSDLTAHEYVAGFLDAGFKKAQKVFKEKDRRAWFIYNHWGSPIPGGESRRLNVVSWMDRHYRKQETKVFRGISVYLYSINDENVK